MIWIVRLLLLLSLFPALAAAQSSVTDGVLINADVMDRDLEKRTVRLRGNVQVVFQGQHLSCDKAEIDLNKQQIVAEGNVILFNERVHVEADRVVFNYKQNTGFIYNGFVQSGQVVFEGDVIQKISESRYIANNASYTACDTCPPGWSFSGRSIDAEIGGYARIRRPIFKLGRIPVLILPGIIVPLKSARQSGFLVPSMEVSGKGGVALSESYFWAISRSQDFTFTPKWYTKRGYKLHGDYRYVLNESSQGRLQSAWIQDKAFRKEEKLTEKFDRWYFWYAHRHEMPENFVHRVDVKPVSDLRYPRDFPNEITGHGDPALENKMSLTKTTSDQMASAEINIYTNLLHAKPLSENDDAVHRAPELRYSIKEQSILDSGLFFSLDSQYVNFARERYNYDDLETTPGAIPGQFQRRAPPLGNQGEIRRDGTFSPFAGALPGDLMRTGQRLDIRPSVSYPFQIARRLDLVPSVSFRETQYRFYPAESAEMAGFSSSAARRYVQTDLVIKTEFTRVYGSSDPKAERLKHSIEPEVGYSHIPWIRRPNHPFFGDFEGLQYSRQFEPISDADLNNSRTGVQFDYHDRTYEKQVMDFGLTNRLTRKIWVNGEPDYRTVGIFRLSQSYDMNEAKSPTPHAWSSVNLLADMRFQHFETYTTAQYNGYAKVTNLSSRLRLMASAKNFVQVNYTRNFIFDEEYTPTGETRNLGLGAGMIMKYFEAVGQFDYEARKFAVQSFGYALNIRPPGKCWMISFEHRQVVGGDAQLRGSFSFDFGGENKNNLF